MEGLQNRIDSFSKTLRTKTGSKTPVLISWPHPKHPKKFLATPAALAEAGFYYEPTKEDPDNVTCFECGKQLSEWEKEDDPFNIHYFKCGEKCSWAAVRCGLRMDMNSLGKFIFPDKTRLPGTKRMEQVRLGTFAVGDGWMHDHPNHGANARKMAQSGFVWTPQHAGDDLATCLYCNIALSGWEKDDDPMEEHRKRMIPDEPCPFVTFTSTSNLSQVPSVASVTSAATTSSSVHRLTRSHSAKPLSRSQSKIVLAPSQSSQPPKAAKTRGKSVDGRKTRKIPEEDNMDEEDVQYMSVDEDSEAPQPQLTRSTSVNPSRSRSKAAFAPSKSSRSSKAAKARGKSIDRRKTQKIVEETADNLDEEVGERPTQDMSMDDDSEAPQPPATRPVSLKPPSRSRSKVVPPSKSSQPLKAANARGKSVDRRKTRKVVEEEATDNADEEDRQPTIQDMSLDEDSGAPSQSFRPPKAAKTRGKSVDRRKTRKIVEEAADNAAEEDGEPTAQIMSLDEDSEAPQPIRSTSMKPPSRSQSKAAPAASQPFRPLKAAQTRGKSMGRRKTQTIVQEATNTEEEEDGEPPVQDMSLDEDSGAPQSQLIRSATVKSSSRSQPKVAPASSRGSQAPKATKTRAKSVGGGKSHQVTEEETTDNADEADDRPLFQGIPEDEESKTPAPPPQHAVQSATKITTSSDQSKVDPTPSHSRATKTREDATGKLNTRKVSEDEATDYVVEGDDHPFSQNLFQGETTAPPHPPATEVTPTQLLPSRHPELLPTSSQSRASKVTKTAAEKSHDGYKIHRVAEETTEEVGEKGTQPADENMSLDDGDAWAALPKPQRGENGRKTSIHNKTPPPADLLALNFDNTPTPSTPLPALALQPADKAPPLSLPIVAKVLPSEKSLGLGILPPLSRIPFMPLRALTDAELDMTVEEWIRYQMEVEFDKLKRDGEKELARFKARAEEVRKMIESL